MPLVNNMPTQAAVGEGARTHDLSQALVKTRNAIRSSDVREKALASHHQGLQVHLHRSSTPTRTTGARTICIHYVHSKQEQSRQRGPVTPSRGSPSMNLLNLFKGARDLLIGESNLRAPPAPGAGVEGARRCFPSLPIAPILTMARD